MPRAQIGKGIGRKTVILLLKNIISFINIVVDKGKGGKGSLFLDVYQCIFAGAEYLLLLLKGNHSNPHFSKFHLLKGETHISFLAFLARKSALPFFSKGK